MTSETQRRGIQMTTHDFEDGNGLVNAHKHLNGGGWVADTAKVTTSAYVGPDAQVSGDAQVYGTAQVRRGEYLSTPVCVTRSDGYTFTLQSDGSIVAGCRDFAPDQAEAHWGNPGHHKHSESMAILRALTTISQARHDI